MGPANTTATTTATVAGFHRWWNSPVPYLFGGLAMMMGLIGLALVILACSYKKYSSDSSSEVEDEEAGKAGQVLKPEMEPKIVVIMAGDDHPTYLAKPVSSASQAEQV